MRIARLLLLFLLSQGSAWAQAPPAVEMPPTATAGPRTFDPEAATRAYLAKVPPEKKARSDAYFEAGYWLQLVDFAAGAIVAFVLLGFGWSARMRDRAERIAPWKPLGTVLYWVQYLVLTGLLLFPLQAYEGYFREQAYGLSTQTFGSWLGDHLKGMGVGLVMGSILLVPLYGVLRRARESWWVWGAGVTVVFLMFAALVGPVFIAPLFNKYEILEDAHILAPILRMAHANGIETDKVYQMDASRQTTRVSANVSGFLGTERITLNDNLLDRCTLAEIKAVMGHEIGHYVLRHVYQGVLFFSVMTVLGFAFVRFGFERAARRFEGRFRVRDVGDVAGLPLFLFLISVFFFVMTPVTNTYIRVNEQAADVFGLNAAREPDGMAEVALKLGEYRKLEPGPLEEWIFYDHPSGRTRIRTAMRWKAENLEDEGSGASASE